MILLIVQFLAGPGDFNISFAVLNIVTFIFLSIRLVPTILPSSSFLFLGIKRRASSHKPLHFVIAAIKLIFFFWKINVK